MPTKEALKVFRNLKYSVVELGFVDVARIRKGWLDAVSRKDLEGFSWVSLHAPKIDYSSQEGVEVLRKIKRIHAERQLDLVVFHPDRVADFGVLEASGLPVGLENMDKRKKAFKAPEDFMTVFRDHPGFKLVLDVNHIFTNDPSMELAKDFYEKFGDRIAEVHLSGYSKLHDPLHETKQSQIVKAIRDRVVPVLIESDLKKDTLKLEAEYVDGLD